MLFRLSLLLLTFSLSQTTFAFEIEDIHFEGILTEQQLAACPEAIKLDYFPSPGEGVLPFIQIEALENLSQLIIGELRRGNLWVIGGFKNNSLHEAIYFHRGGIKEFERTINFITTPKDKVTSFVYQWKRKGDEQRECVFEIQ